MSMKKENTFERQTKTDLEGSGNMSLFGIVDVVEIQEFEDGSAIMTIETTQETLKKLAAIAVQKILIEQMENESYVD